MRKALITAIGGCLLAACGGGSSPISSLAALQGVLEDSQGSPVADMEVMLRETGGRNNTGVDGSFGFEVEPGIYTLMIGNNEAEVDCESGRVDVRVEIEDGDIKEVDAGHEKYQHTFAAFEGEGGVLLKIKLDADDGRLRFEVEVERLEPGTIVDISLRETALGRAIADAGGEASLRIDTGRGDLLPLGARSLTDLAGLRVDVTLDSNGELLIRAEVPDLAEQPRKKEDDGESEDEGKGESEEK